MPPVAITIDTEFPDQPATDPLGALEELLRILAGRDVRATFFVVGAWARAHPEQLLEIKSAGHQIGNHSYAHCPLPRMTERGIVEDLNACHEVLAGLGIESRPWFRAPGGELEGGEADVEAAIQRAGYRHIHWHAHGEDWRPGSSPEQVAAVTLEGIERRWPRPAIALFHSWPDPSPRALTLVLDRLQDTEASFLTLDQLGWRQELAGRVREATGRRLGG